MNEQPLVSVIMAVRNEERFIRESLRAILNQDYPKEKMEIIIADGMSQDRTRRILQEEAQKFPHLKIIDNPKKIVSSGLNAALNYAQGDIIVRVDGHTLIAADYVRQCVEILKKGEADNVGGEMNAVGKTFFGQIVALATSSFFGIGNASFHYSDKAEWTDTVYLGAWDKKIFSKLGGFDTELVRNQDDEFNYRLRKAGGKILLSPNIRSEYFSRTSLRSLASQYFQYGYWKVRVLQKHPKQMQWRHFVPPLFAAAFAALAALAFVSGIAKSALVFLFLLYAATNLTASAFSVAGKWNWILLLSLTYGVLHFSYGFGFLSGLIAFRDRWKEARS